MDVYQDFKELLELLNAESVEYVVQLGRPPIRIDIITSIDGVTWEKIWKGKVEGFMGATRVNFIGRREFNDNSYRLRPNHIMPNQKRIYLSDVYEKAG